MRDSLPGDTDAYGVAGWYAAEAAWWPQIARTLPCPWPRAAVLQDMRYLQNEVAAGRRKRIPTRRVLSSRWGWSDGRVRTVMRREDLWADPGKVTRRDRATTRRDRATTRRDQASTKTAPWNGHLGPDLTDPQPPLTEGRPGLTEQRQRYNHTRAVQQEQEPEQEAEEYVQDKPAPSPESDTRALWPGIEEPPSQRSEAAKRGAGTRKAEEAFEIWWASVPRKKAKRAAKARAWPAALKRLGWSGYADGTLSQAVWVIAQGTDRWRREAAEAESPKYVCMPATWLNQDRWEDEEAAQASHDDAPSWQAGRERSRTQLADKLRADVAALEERERDEGLPEGLAAALEAKRKRLEALEGVA